MNTDGVLDQRLTIPEGVVRRSFAEETIVLNLQTGQYHGLNATAAAMLDGLAEGRTPRDVAAEVAARAGVPVARVEADIVALIAGLRERSLVDVDG